MYGGVRWHIPLPMSQCALRRKSPWTLTHCDCSASTVWFERASCRLAQHATLPPRGICTARLFFGIGHFPELAWFAKSPPEVQLAGEVLFLPYFTGVLLPFVERINNWNSNKNPNLSYAHYPVLLEFQTRVEVDLACVCLCGFFFQKIVFEVMDRFELH